MSDMYDWSYWVFSGGEQLEATESAIQNAVNDFVLGLPEEVMHPLMLAVMARLMSVDGRAFIEKLHDMTSLVLQDFDDSKNDDSIRGMLIRDIEKGMP